MIQILPKVKFVKLFLPRVPEDQESVVVAEEAVEGEDQQQKEVLWVGFFFYKNAVYESNMVNLNRSS